GWWWWGRYNGAEGEGMIRILGGLGTFERHLILARTDEGRKRAQARGVRFGRKRKLSAFQIAEAIARPEAGEALIDIGRSYNVSHSTISRLAGAGGGDDRSQIDRHDVPTTRISCHV